MPNARKRLVKRIIRSSERNSRLPYQSWSVQQRLHSTPSNSRQCVPAAAARSGSRRATITVVVVQQQGSSSQVSNSALYHGCSDLASFGGCLSSFHLGLSHFAFYFLVVRRALRQRSAAGRLRQYPLDWSPLRVCSGNPCIAAAGIARWVVCSGFIVVGPRLVRAVVVGVGLRVRV